MNRPVVRRAPPARRPRRYRTILILVLFALAGAAVALTIVTRIESGEWMVPEVAALQRIVKLAPRAPARTIFLQRRPVEVYPGDNDAERNVSSVLWNVREEAAAKAALATKATKTTATPKKPSPDPARPAKLPGWKGSDKAWNQVVSCVAKLFEPFDVTVTDQAPAAGADHVLVLVGGRASDLGVTSRRIAGLAPFNGDVIATPVVFAFSAQLGHGVRAVCETIGMEVAHAYGLDHSYLCSDVMTYRKPCGAKRFVDKDVRCGESKPRNCEGGAPTQNSYRRLLQLLGPRSSSPRPRASSTSSPSPSRPPTSSPFHRFGVDPRVPRQLLLAIPRHRRALAARRHLLGVAVHVRAERVHVVALVGHEHEACAVLHVHDRGLREHQLEREA